MHLSELSPMPIYPTANSLEKTSPQNESITNFTLNVLLFQHFFTLLPVGAPDSPLAHETEVLANHRGNTSKAPLVRMKPDA